MLLNINDNIDDVLVINEINDQLCFDDRII